MDSVAIDIFWLINVKWWNYKFIYLQTTNEMVGQDNDSQWLPAPEEGCTCFQRDVYLVGPQNLVYGKLGSCYVVQQGWHWQKPVVGNRTNGLISATYDWKERGREAFGFQPTVTLTKIVEWLFNCWRCDHGIVFLCPVVINTELFTDK